MPKLRSLLFLSPLLVAVPVHAQFTDVINSNRPGESMAAFSVGKTVFQAEAGLYGLQENHNLTEYELNGFGGDSVGGALCRSEPQPVRQPVLPSAGRKDLAEIDAPDPAPVQPLGIRDQCLRR